MGFRFALAVAIATTAAVACSSGGEGVTGDEANVTEGCEVRSSKDGHVLSREELAALGDPVATLVLQGEGCPKTLGEINQKLVTKDPCRPAAPGAPAEPGLATRFVSERTSLLDTPDEYRTVISRQCQGRKVHELLMSAFVTAGPGGDIDKSVVSASVELIGERRDASDPENVSGVFNYYARENGKWTFFGSSDEFVSQGYDCNADGACIPKAAAKQRCAGCHVGGGLVMKELESPWTFWEPSRAPPMPGTTALTKKFPALFGTRLNATEMEQSVVRAGNAEWAAARLDVLKKKGLREVLRPLFCTLDMNLQGPSIIGAEIGLPIPQVLNEAIFLDPAFPNRPRLASGLEFIEAEKAIGQRVIDSVTGKPFKSGDDIARRSSVPAPGALSLAHRQLLLDAGIVDMDFVKDVLAIDLTRPTYSSARCGLLERVPELPATEMQPARIKAALSEALVGAPGPAEALRAHLLDAKDEPAHDAAARGFLEACKARQKTDPEGFAKDVVRYSAHLRKAARRAGGIIETSEMLAEDDVPDAREAFSPKTCKLE